MSFGVVSVTAETDCPLTVSLLVTAVSGKMTFGRSLPKGAMSGSRDNTSAYLGLKTKPVDCLASIAGKVEAFG